jgi:hypothetical protein
MSSVETSSEEIKKALVSHYLIIHGELSEENASVHNEWWRLCEKLDIPFIQVQFEEHFANVQVDTFDCSKDYDENGAALIRKTFEEEIDALPPKTRKRGFLYGRVYSEIHKVLPERAEALAAKLFRIWEQYNKPSPNLTREQ